MKQTWRFPKMAVGQFNAKVAIQDAADEIAVSGAVRYVYSIGRAFVIGTCAPGEGTSFWEVNNRDVIAHVWGGTAYHVEKL